MTTLFVVPIIYSYLRIKPPVDHERQLVEAEREGRVERLDESDAIYRTPNLKKREALRTSLRKEVEDLRRQLAGASRPSASNDAVHAGEAVASLPRRTIWAIVLARTVLVVAAFFAGYIPLQKRNALIRGEAAEQEQRRCRAWK